LLFFTQTPLFTKLSKHLITAQKCMVCITLNPFLFQDCANSGHITGIAVLDNCHVLTCSVDQRVSLWKISQTANPFELVCQKFSHVPDLHDIVVVDHRHVVVVGAGMQIFKINYKC
jgi:hypothetical protein